MSIESAAYWSISEQEVLDQLGTTSHGLSDTESRQRLGLRANQDLENRQASNWSIFVSQFNNPIILLLFLSAVLSWLLDDGTNALIIFLILG